MQQSTQGFFSWNEEELNRRRKRNEFCLLFLVECANSYTLIKKGFHMSAQYTGPLVSGPLLNRFSDNFHVNLVFIMYRMYAWELLSDMWIQSEICYGSASKIGYPDSEILDPSKLNPDPDTLIFRSGYPDPEPYS